MLARRWWVVLVVIACLFVAAMALLGGSRRADITRVVGDAADVDVFVNAVAHLHFSRAYDPHLFFSSPPGYAYLASPLIALARPTFGEVAHFWVSVGVCLLLLPVCSAVARATGVPARSDRELRLLVLVLIAAGLSVLSGFHPQDVAATVLLLAGLAAALRGRWTYAGASLGLAMLTRQWAVLGALPVIAAAPIARRWATVWRATAVVLLGIIPFALADPHGLWRGLHVPWEPANYHALLTYVPGFRAKWFWGVSRIAPIAVAVALVGSAVHRARGELRQPRVLVGLTSACIVIRLVFETAIWPYYLLPTLVLILVYGRASFDRPLAVWAWTGLVALFMYAPIDLTNYHDRFPVADFFWSNTVHALALWVVFASIIVAGVWPAMSVKSHQSAQVPRD